MEVDNDVVEQVWPSDMEVTQADEDVGRESDALPVDNQAPVVENNAEITQETATEEPETKETETPAETNTEPIEQTAEQPAETPAETETATETPAENTEAAEEAPPETPEAEASGPLFDHVRTSLNLPEDATPQEIQDRALEHIQELETYRVNNRKANAELTKLLKSDPAFAGFTMDLMGGAPLVVALAKNFDMNILKPKPGDSDYGKYKDAVEERTAKIERESQSLQKLKANQELSGNHMQSFVQAEGISEQEAPEFFGPLAKDLENLQDGLITPEFLKTYRKGLKYDKDLAKAKETALIAGRNQKIVAKKQSNIAEAEPPSLQPSGSAPEQPAEDDDWVTSTVNKFVR